MAHRFVCIGDSLTQGFKSGAIFEPHLSTPALVAHEMGLPLDDFRYAPFSGEGGLPLNIEYILRKLEHVYGKNVNIWELPFAAISLRQWMDHIEDYWERGLGSKPLNYSGPYHNLAVWGFEIQDSWQVTAGMCEKAVLETKDNWLQQIPESPMLRTALRVLNPSLSQEQKDRDATQVSRVAELAADGGIENLFIFLGANNILGSVVSLDVRKSSDDDLTIANPKDRNANVYTPQHYEVLMGRLMEKIKNIHGIQRVFWSTTPPVTIPPITHGVCGRLESDMGKASPYGPNDDPNWYRRYFKYYTRPWINNQRFNPEEDPKLTGEQAIEIDTYIIEYKKILQRLIDNHNHQENDQKWHLVDMHWALERLAARRYENGIAPPPPNWSPYPMPEAYQDLKLDMNFLQAKKGKRIKGGLVSLDGVHPTTLGYGIAAQEIIDTMYQAGVVFNNRLGQPRPDKPIVDYQRLIRLDTLVSHPPQTLDDVWRKLGIGDEIWDVFQRVFRALEMKC